MKNLPTLTSWHYRWQHKKTTGLALAALALLFPLLAACVPQTVGSPTLAVTPTPTDQPQTAVPTASLPPTTTADSQETIDRTTRPTPVLLDETALPTLGTPVAGEVPPNLLQTLLADLAERLEVSVEEITVVQARAVEWNDGSLGCPQPGMMYIQVITRGFRVILIAKDQMFDYHTDTKAQFVLCNPDGMIEDPLPLLPIKPGN